MSGPDRQCGACSACCTSLGVVALDKPANTPCVHQVGKGCSIYETRPDECQTYKCGWLSGFFDGADRPDRLGVIFDFSSDPTGTGLVFARELIDGAAERAWRQVRLVTAHTVVIILRLDGSRRVEGPAALVEQYWARVKARLPVVQS